MPAVSTRDCQAMRKLSGPARDHATAYERRQEVVVRASAVNSCAADMALWLLAQLGEEQADGRTVMSPDTVARSHAPQMVLPKDRTYPTSTRHACGLGWMISRHRDRRLVEHRGGIDGFLTECMLLPDDGIGVAVTRRRLPRSGKIRLGSFCGYGLVDSSERMALGVVWMRLRPADFA